MGDRMPEPMQAITILQPYPFAILRRWKKLECRSWLPPKGAIGTRIAIHSGRSTAKLLDPAARLFFMQQGFRWPDDLPLGAVVGTALLTGWVAKSKDPWFKNAGEKYGWQLEDVLELPKPIPCRGQQGIWKLPEVVAAQVRAQEASRAA